MEWFESWFDTPYYHILYSNRDYTEAENFITQLTAELQLPKNSEIIDLACGKGRHSVFLNKLGYKVLGLDLSKKSIEHNQQFENENLQFKVHDMRDTVAHSKVDAVFNLFTSFGYFDSQDDDRKVFKSVSDVLKSDGFFVLDYLNENYVRKTIVSDAEIQRGGIDFTISKKIEDQHIVKDIKFSADGQDFNFFEKVKLHTPDSIQKYAEDNGFERVKIWGDYQLNDFDAEVSPRCINLFKKK
ncbi:Methyltransferase domain-containing protein [Chryseobacterium piscicola]|uniref:Methyltransferase domain-containing protein n=1 Tax=Chryseobacterium piscicola TaxID=551459 RepID=A0A1N7NTJ2_9FLAO|nr:class I SAM-dependent methyltransferase [Chryseobacterium piscicola]PQA94146.1 SAM-dependent methyltransferase [Chryseobacterium piscicola]SIT01637.1 Methyltransferase domain-containing protein [Chryseobacterium piscicola]